MPLDRSIRRARTARKFRFTFRRLWHRTSGTEPPPVRHPLTRFTLLTLLICVCPPLSADGGTIQTVVTSTQRVDAAGTIELGFTIQNNGNATAYHVAAELLLARHARRYRDLGDNLPGGHIKIEDKLVKPDVIPGQYIAVLKINFEEQNGRAHRAYHFFHVPYRLQRIHFSPPPLILKTEDLSFNKRAFWEKRRPIRMSMKNQGKATSYLHTRLFLPEGVSSPKSEWKCRLAPGEKRVEAMPVDLKTGGGQGGVYHLIVGYNHHHVHYSQHLKGHIRVEERPVYFKAYLILGLAVLVICFLLLYLRRRSAARPFNS